MCARGGLERPETGLFRTASFEAQSLARGRPRIVGDGPAPRLGDARTVPLQERELPDREVHGLLVDQLLDAMQNRLALLPVELGRLLSEEAVDVRIATIGVDAARDRERLDPGGGVAEDAARLLGSPAHGSRQRLGEAGFARAHVASPRWPQDRRYTILRSGPRDEGVLISSES